MQMIRQWLAAWRVRQYKQASMENLSRFDRDLTALGDMYARDVLTEKEYDKRVKELQRQSEESHARLQSILESKPRITDLPTVRFVLELLAWTVIFTVAAFLLHPSWVDRNIGETIAVACAGGLAHGWRRVAIDLRNCDKGRGVEPERISLVVVLPHT